jgi:hypothetical protein
MATAKRSSASGRKSPAASSRAKSARTSGASKTTKRGQSAKPASASAAPKRPAATKTAAPGTAATNGAKRSRTASPRGSAAANGSARARGSANSNRRTASSQNGSAGRRTTPRTAQASDGVVESMKHTGAAALRAASRAGGPTVTVLAAAAGIAGGLLLRQRPHTAGRDGLGARSRELLHEIDPAAVIDGLGRASMLVSRRSKGLARDIDQIADRAERLSKVLR